MSIVPFNLQKNLIINPSGKLMCVDARQPFTLKINTIYGNGNNTFALPLTNHTTNLKIETSDGQSITITNYTDPAKLISFPSAGVYTIKMRGECGWSFNNTGDCQKLIGISNWGRLKFNYIQSGFYGCINLTSLPLSGSINAPLITSLQSLFYKCGKLKNIGSSDIFKRCLKVTTFQSTFLECALTSIPVGLFDNCINVTNFQSTFQSNQLTSIPVGLFDNCSLVTNFGGTFQQNLLTSIPLGLFDSCSLVTIFYITFYSNKLTSIPVGLFDNCTNVTNFQSTFQSNQLTSIPVGLFDSCTNVTNFQSTFQSNQLTSIPVGLFDNCSLVTNFQSTFTTNKLTSIPVGLFDNCSLVTNFGGTFQQNLLTSIPLGLFDSCSLVTTFYITFNTNLITSIPENLFLYNPSITNYSRTFQNALASGCTMPTVMFDLSQIAKVTSWQSMFDQTSTIYSPLGTVQDIWNYASPTATKTDCFNNCTQLTNYTSIPVDWI